jgi:hypothetical protein
MPAVLWPYEPFPAWLVCVFAGCFASWHLWRAFCAWAFARQISKTIARAGDENRIAEARMTKAVSCLDQGDFKGFEEVYRAIDANHEQVDMLLAIAATDPPAWVRLAWATDEELERELRKRGR